MDKLKEFDAKQFVRKFIEESVGDFIAFEELALAAYTYGVEQALATLEQPGNDPEYLTALESGLDNETQEQFIERTGIVQPPSVRPVTGNAPKVRLTEDQVRSALIVAGDYCGMSHVRLQTEELNRILALAGTPDQASDRAELPPSAKEPRS